MFQTILKRIRISARPVALLTVVLVLALVGGTALAAPGALSRIFEPAASPPTLVSYQGYVEVSSVAYTGTGYFKFAVMDAASGNGAANYWANDGTASGEPAASVAVTVDDGLFNVMLGDTSLAGMSQAITQSAFYQTTTYLRIWFSQTSGGPFQALDPNQRIASAPYALRACAPNARSRRMSRLGSAITRTRVRQRCPAIFAGPDLTTNCVTALTGAPFS